ncbi:MAG: hypothetical protein QOE55_723 [Acidobacteriaceae bacterium]|nr:hypothetical protein [Acidobacteriaceae bacterium]
MLGGARVAGALKQERKLRLTPRLKLLHQALRVGGSFGFLMGGKVKVVILAITFGENDPISCEPLCVCAFL